MISRIFVNYWIGQETSPPSPTLDQMPGYVDIVPLAFATVDSNSQLDFGFLTQTFPAEQIQVWIKTLRARGTKVLMSIIDAGLGSMSPTQQNAFIQSVVECVETWGVDGIDFDYEPPQASDTLVPLIQAVRAALPEGMIFTAPIYFPWLSVPTLLAGVAGAVDYVMTMDYTPYPGWQSTNDLCSQYAKIIGGWSKLIVGVSCMGPPDSGDFTPIGDAFLFASTAQKGVMLYTFSYDVTSRNDGTSGTGLPDGEFTRKIIEGLSLIADPSAAPPLG